MKQSARDGEEVDIFSVLIEKEEAALRGQCNPTEFFQAAYKNFPYSVEHNLVCFPFYYNFPKFLRILSCEIFRVTTVEMQDLPPEVC